MRYIKKISCAILEGVLTFSTVFGTTVCADDASNTGAVQEVQAAEQNGRMESELVRFESAESEKAQSGAAIFDPSALTGETISLDMSWPWADKSAIHTGSATLYRVPEDGNAPERKNITVCVNAGHGTSGGGTAQTLSHPDGTPKVTGGTNAEGAVYSISISSGMTFEDGTPEAAANLMVAMSLKGKLLKDGYDVLMIRESEDVQLDNIARTVIANQNADLHVAIHFDGTSTDKGCFYMGVPDIASYKEMEPVASHWEEHTLLGESLVAGLKEMGLRVFENGVLNMDLTQTSYSTIPSVDIELGDEVSDHSQEACDVYAQGLKDGIDLFARQSGL